jgi:hypothetical protein
VRDEHRDDFDAGRGGWSAAEKEKSEWDRTQHQAEVYAEVLTRIGLWHA